MTEFDPGLAKLREAAVTMAATLASFATVLLIGHAARLTTGIAILAVALSLSIGRQAARADNGSVRGVALAAVVLPLVAVGGSEIGTVISRHPDLGDALFVLSMSATIWVRRFGPVARQIAGFAALPLVITLIIPAPVAAGNGQAGDGWWWPALIALVALGWVTAARTAAGRAGFLIPVPAQPAATQAATSPAGRRIAVSTKMALQMAAALGAAFAVGRGLFGPHWTWAVLTAFIVGSGNRSRGDVVHKAALRVAGAGIGTLAATALSGAFAPRDRWSIVVIFAVLAVALWLRQINYAYWAAGLTAALALLYGYYGERGIGLLGTRLEAILAGAALAVAASWLLLPVRTTDIIRRDIGAALAALDGYLAALAEDRSSVPAREDRFRQAVGALDYARAMLRAVPAPVRPRFGYRPALAVLEQCAAGLPSVTEAVLDQANESRRRDHLDALRTGIKDLRQANARRLPADAAAWNSLAGQVDELPRMLESPPPPPARDRFWPSSQKILACANRAHATSYELASELSRAGTVLTYLVEDTSGQQALLTWSRDSSQSQILPAPAAGSPPAGVAAGRTPKGYPYRLASVGLPDRPAPAPAAQTD